MIMVRIATTLTICIVGRALHPSTRGLQEPGKARGHPEMRNIGEGDIKVTLFSVFGSVN